MVSVFQSTRPVRGATYGDHTYCFVCEVSIHAPRAGRDCSRTKSIATHDGFNPRAPCGARPRGFLNDARRVSFQSTRPVRGATERTRGMRFTQAVSIHAPRAGRDRASSSARSIQSKFQSTRPVRGATQILYYIQKSLHSFNPRAPCGARQQKKLRLPSFATYLWVLLATNMIFSMSEQRTLLSCAAST